MTNTTENLPSTLVVTSLQILMYDRSYGDPHEEVYETRDEVLSDDSERRGTISGQHHIAEVPDNAGLTEMLESMMPTSYKITTRDAQYLDEITRGVRVIAEKKNYRRRVIMVRELSLTVMPGSMFGDVSEGNDDE